MITKIDVNEPKYSILVMCVTKKRRLNNKSYETSKTHGLPSSNLSSGQDGKFHHVRCKVHDLH